MSPPTGSKLTLKTILYILCVCVCICSDIHTDIYSNESNYAATTGRVVVWDCTELWFNGLPGEKLHQFYFIFCPLLLLLIQMDDECCFYRRAKLECGATLGFFGCFFFPVCLVVWLFFCFSFFGLECKPFVFLGWWSCHLKNIIL